MLEPTVRNRSWKLLKKIYCRNRRDLSRKTRCFRFFGLINVFVLAPFCCMRSVRGLFFPRASEHRVLPIVGVCISSSHLHIFSSSHLHIFTSSHLHIFTSSHLLIFTCSHLHICSSSHFHIFTSAHLHIFSSSHPHIFTSSHLHIFTSSHLHICSSSHLLILTSSHLLIFTFSHPHIFTSSHPHIFTYSPLALLPSCPLALLPSCPLALLPSCTSSSHPHIFTSSHFHIFSSCLRFFHAVVTPIAFFGAGHCTIHQRDLKIVACAFRKLLLQRKERSEYTINLIGPVSTLPATHMGSLKWLMVSSTGTNMFMSMLGSAS